jgi:amino acid transporter
LNKSFGTGVFTGSLNLLLWLSYIVMLSLYASAFGSYGSVFFPESLQFWAKHLLISGAIVGITGLNLLSADLIGRAERGNCPLPWKRKSGIAPLRGYSSPVA